MRNLIVVGLVCLSSVAWAQTPKQKSPPATEASLPVEVSADPQATSATYGDWLLICRRTGDAQQCQVTQQIHVQGQPGPIARLIVSRNDAPRGLHLTVVLPTNVTLRAEPIVTHGETKDDEVKLVWARCAPGGCTADADLADDVVKSWRGTTERGRVAFKDGHGREIAVPISFRGLAPALDALVSK